MKSIKTLIPYVPILIISFFSLSETRNTNTNTHNTTGLTIDLHHLVFNPTSTQYNPSLSHFQRVAVALNRSSFNRRLTSFSQATPTITNPSGTYYMNFFIGRSRVFASGILSTGSDLISTSCTSKAQPLTHLSCRDTPCTSFPGRTCKGNARSCTYYTRYADQTFSQGYLFRGTIAFSKTHGPHIDDVVFGCKTKNSEAVVGLGGGAVSLVQKLERKKIGFCLAPFSKTSKMHLGEYGDVCGGKKGGTVVIPLVVDSKKPTFYRVWVNTITVGRQTLNLRGKMLIDTGTTKTMFPEPFYTRFLAALRNSINGKMIRAPLGLDSDLCYSKAPNFNGIKVEFGNKVELTWKTENIFLQFGEHLWCLAAGKSTIEDSISGSASLTDFFVGLDLQHKTATFQPRNCGSS